MKSVHFFKKSWDYAKNKFRSGVAGVNSFGQTTLGSAIFGGVVASSATYLFGHSQLTQERNAAWKALKEHENEYNNLQQINIRCQTIKSEFELQVSKLLDDKISSSEKHSLCETKYEKCIADIKHIDVLHANSFFKPSIKPIVDEYGASLSRPTTMNIK